MTVRQPYNIALTKGGFGGGLNESADGVIYGSIKEVAARLGVVITKRFPGVGAASNGLCIYIPQGVDGGEFVVDAKGEGAQLIIVIEKDASANVYYTFAESNGDSVRSVYAGENARLRIEEFISVADGKHDVTNYVSQESGSSAETVTVLLGSENVAAKYKTDLNGEGAESKHSALFAASGNDKCAFGVTVNHKVAGCRSDVLVKGVASGSARGEFTGLVYVAKDAQHTEAYQQSRNLLLSEGARVLTSPQLEIYADDVKCSHGATVGQLDNEAVYYMRQRGLSEEQARGLQLSGFLNEIVSRFSNEEMREKVLTLAEQKLGINNRSN